MDKRQVILEQSLRGYDNPNLAQQVYNSYLELRFVPKDLIDLEVLINSTTEGLSKGLGIILKKYATEQVFRGCSVVSGCNTSRVIHIEDEEETGYLSNARRIVEERVQ
jgi:hypothetical protein